jgi:hypothetical protein
VTIGLPFSGIFGKAIQPIAFLGMDPQQSNPGTRIDWLFDASNRDLHRIALSTMGAFLKIPLRTSEFVVDSALMMRSVAGKDVGLIGVTASFRLPKKVRPQIQ